MKTRLKIKRFEDGSVEIDADPGVIKNAETDSENPLAALVSGVDTEDKKVDIVVRTEELTYGEIAVQAIKNALGQ
jgi:hypothetical protein